VTGRPVQPGGPRLLVVDGVGWQATDEIPVRGTITDTICVTNKPVTRAVADDPPGAFFDRGAFPGTLVKVEQRKIG